MATATIDVKGQSQTEGQQRTATEGVGSPISNEAFNVISALHEKLNGLEAYRKYSKDADGDLWRELTKLECGAVERLVVRLEQLVKEGKFRMKEPGQANH